MAKRLVILTRDDLPHRYVANSLCRAVEIDAILVDRTAGRSTLMQLKRALRRGPLHAAAKVARAAFLKALGDRATYERALRRVLGEQAERFVAPEKVIDIKGVNSPETVRLLRGRKPDSILVYGTSVVADATLRTASDICFNMHTGISPYYRGTSCAFWPVVNGEFDMIGATVHECTSNLDGGKIFATVYASAAPGDDLHTIFGRTVKVGADAYVRVVKDYLSGPLQGSPQDLSLGREYRGAELTIWPEIVARFRLAARNIGRRQ